jgi:hypothetical protein
MSRTSFSLRTGARISLKVNLLSFTKKQIAFINPPSILKVVTNEKKGVREGGSDRY